MSKEISKKFWFRLDNSASVYPMVITLNTQSLFRIGAELTEYVDRDDLLAAVKEAFLRYPHFKVELRGGIFRYSFVVNHRDFLVEEDDGSLLKKIDFGRNRAYLLRLTYYKKKIFLDIFHGLGDGTSALEFMKTLIHCYFKIRGAKIPSDGLIKIPGEVIPEGEIEDGFLKYFKKINIREGTKKMAGADAFGLSGKYFKTEGFGLIQGFLNTNALRLASKKYNCSVTVLIAAVVMLSVSKVYNPDVQNRDLVVFIPVNLRKFFPSESMLNFTSMVKCRIKQSEERTLENFIKCIDPQLKEQLEIDDLQKKLSFTSLLYKRVFRFTPLFVKSFMARIGRLFSLTTKQTMIISNLGQVTLPEGYGEKVDNFFFNLNCSRKTPNNMTIISYREKTVISFTRQIISTELEREFFSALSDLGLNVKVISNFREAD